MEYTSPAPSASHSLEVSLNMKNAPSPPSPPNNLYFNFASNWDADGSSGARRCHGTAWLPRGFTSSCTGSRGLCVLAELQQCLAHSPVRSPLVPLCGIASGLTPCVSGSTFSLIACDRGTERASSSKMMWETENPPLLLRKVSTNRDAFKMHLLSSFCLV